MPLVPNTSPLRTVPIRVERKSILYFDGVRYSFHIFEMASNRLLRTIQGLQSSPSDPSALTEAIAAAMSDAWLMIDSVHRLRELLQQLPRLKKNQAELQIFLKRTSKVEDLRHFFQHFRNNIDAFAEKAMPLWGTLSWASTDPTTGDPVNFTLIPGTFFPGAISSGCAFSTPEGTFVDRILLDAGAITIDLAYLADHVSEFCYWYTNWFGAQFSEAERNEHNAADMNLRIIVKNVRKASEEMKEDR